MLHKVTLAVRVLKVHTLEMAWEALVAAVVVRVLPVVMPA
jgi:hypothetical protein